MKFFIDRRVFSHFDYLLWLIILPIVTTSAFLVGELNNSMGFKQLSYIFIGLSVFVFVFILPIRRLLWLIPIFYWLDIILLISVKFFGISILGAKRWLEIPIIHLTIQPSELMKPALMLMLAYLIQKRPPPPEGYSGMEFVKMMGYIILPFVLIAIEPDLGSATVLLLVGCGVLFVFGVRWQIWAGLVVIAVLSSTFIYENLHDYQKGRILALIGDKPSYQIQQSIIAIGSGGITGKTKEESTQAQLKFLPIATSDFIFAYHVERFGFVGAVLLILAYAILIIHLILQALSFRDDLFSSVFTLSVALLIFIYMGVNTLMTIGLAPVVGVPLPLFSSGGTSFLNFMILFAIYENLLAFRYNFSYNYTFKI